MNQELGENYPAKEYQRLFNAIDSINGTPLVAEMQNIISIVHEDFPAPDHVPDTGNMISDAEQWFDNNFNCYTRAKNADGAWESSIKAVTKSKFLEYFKSINNGK